MAIMFCLAGGAAILAWGVYHQYEKSPARAIATLAFGVYFFLLCILERVSR